MSSLFTSLCSYLGTDHTPTTAYHPQANGLVERMHRRLKSSLRALEATSHWPSALPWVCLGLRAAPTEDDNISSFEATFGAAPSLPSTLLREDSPQQDVLEGLLRAQQGLPVREPPSPPPSPATAVPPGLRFVYVREDGPRGPLSKLYRGPYKVLRQLRNTVVVQLGDRQDTISLARIKPCLAPSPIIAAPPAQGRPRRTSRGTWSAPVAA